VLALYDIRATLRGHVPVTSDRECHCGVSGTHSKETQRAHKGLAGGVNSVQIDSLLDSLGMETGVGQGTTPFTQRAVCSLCDDLDFSLTPTRVLETKSSRLRSAPREASQCLVALQMALFRHEVAAETRRVVPIDDARAFAW